MLSFHFKLLRTLHQYFYRFLNYQKQQKALKYQFQLTITITSR